MQITVSPELERLARKEVADGRYPSIDALVEHAVRQLLEDERGLGELRAKIDQGFAEAEAGLLYTPEEAKAMLRARREQWSKDNKSS